MSLECNPPFYCSALHYKNCSVQFSCSYQHYTNRDGGERVKIAPIIHGLRQLCGMKNATSVNLATPADWFSFNRVMTDN